MAGMAALGALPIGLLAIVLPLGLVLPVLSVGFLAVAALLALIAWRRHSSRNSEKVTLWDVSGACAFIGFGAAILSRPEHVLTAFAPLGG